MNECIYASKYGVADVHSCLRTSCMLPSEMLVHIILLVSLHLYLYGIMQREFGVNHGKTKSCKPRLQIINGYGRYAFNDIF